MSEMEVYFDTKRIPDVIMVSMRLIVERKIY